jgi:hypothetical protein
VIVFRTGVFVFAARSLTVDAVSDDAATAHAIVVHTTEPPALHEKLSDVPLYCTPANRWMVCVCRYTMTGVATTGTVLRRRETMGTAPLTMVRLRELATPRYVRVMVKVPADAPLAMVSHDTVLFVRLGHVAPPWAVHVHANVGLATGYLSMIVDLTVYELCDETVTASPRLVIDTNGCGVVVVNVHDCVLLWELRRPRVVSVSVYDAPGISAYAEM